MNALYFIFSPSRKILIRRMPGSTKTSRCRQR